MIIQLLMNLVYAVFAVLLLPINLPSMPDGVATNLEYALDYMATAVPVLGAFFDLPYLFDLFLIILVVDAAILVYKLVMWVIKKVPMLGIE